MASDFSSVYWSQNPDALLVLSPEGAVLEWNPAAEVIFGYSAEEARGRPLAELVLPADRTDEEEHILAAARAGGTSVHESVRRRKDGTLVHVNVSTKAIRDARGDVRYFLSSKKDVTQLKVQRDAKLLEARFLDLLESTPDAIVMVNVTGRIVLLNSQAERVFGYARDELLGQPVEVLLPHRYRSVHVGHRGGFFGHPRTRAMGAGLELHGLNKSGQEFPVEISLSPLETEEGVFVCSAIRDATERKQIEQALREKNLELENAALIKDRFLASMSHELRTPLNAILGFTGTLLMQLPGPLNEEQDKQLRIVQSGARHLLSLINDLLDVAKLNASKITVNLELLDCRDVVDEVCATLEPEARRKGLGFEVQIPARPLPLSTDRRAFSQILLNLLGNALKFTAEGMVSLTLRELHGPAGQTLEVRVSDTGPGIDPAAQARLFEAFSRIEGSHGRGQEGTGLGLHLSRKLAHALGGDVWVESVPGQGSTFILQLPAGA